MLKRSRKASDPNELAAAIGQEATVEPKKPREKNPAAVELGRLGGKKGGPARAARLSKHRRKAIAKKAARARWSQRKTSSG